MIRPLRRCLLALTLLASASLALAGRPTVVVSIHPYADLVQRVAGPDAEVIQVLPSGASPHTFEPSPSDARAIARAGLVVRNGGVDDWLARLVQAANPGVPTFVALASLRFQPIQGDAQEGANPHVWLDPSLMAELVPPLAEAIAAVDPPHAAGYRTRAAGLADALRALDGELAGTLAPVAGKPFVPFHDGWPYFARRYALDLVVTLEPFPGREPSARYLAQAVAAIRAAGAPVIFSERQLDPRPAEVVAQSAGVHVLLLDPLGRDDESYEELLRAAAATVREGLAGAP